MANCAQILRRMSDYLDAGRPEVKVITMNVKRKTALKAGAKPINRGGPLYFRGREIITLEARH